MSDNLVKFQSLLRELFYQELIDNGWQKIQIKTVAHAAGKIRNSSLQGEGSASQKVPRVETIWVSPNCPKQQLELCFEC
jgi:hypothetical protein